MKLENVYANINSIEDIEQLFNEIENSIKYTNNLFKDYRHRRVAIEDTEWIRGNLVKIDKGIKKLKNCSLCTSEELEKFMKRREKYNED